MAISNLNWILKVPKLYLCAKPNQIILFEISKSANFELQWKLVSKRSYSSYPYLRKGSKTIEATSIFLPSLSRNTFVADLKRKSYFLLTSSILLTFIIFRLKVEKIKIFSSKSLFLESRTESDGVRNPIEEIFYFFRMVEI